MNANNEQTANLRHVFVLKQISRKGSNLAVLTKLINWTDYKSVLFDIFNKN